MSEQLTLIEGVRIERPASYDDIICAMLTGIGNNPVLGTWAPDVLAEDIYEGAVFNDPQPTVEDIERSIKIWREASDRVTK